MKTFKILAGILLFSILGAFAWALILPADIHIKEKIVIDAPIEKVFSQVNNFHNWKNWSQYDDSLLKTKFEGPKEGLGAKMLWDDEKEGQSVNTIIESIENVKVVAELSFNNQKENAQSLFYFKETVTGVEVTWAMDVVGLSFPFGRFVGYMINKGASYNFAKSLQTMKEYVESTKDIQEYDGLTINDDQFAERNFLCIADSGTMAELGGKIGNANGQIMIKMSELQVKLAGSPCVEWNSYNPEAISSFRCMLPVSSPQEIVGQVHGYTIPAGRFIWVKYIGSYEGSFVAWNNLDKYLEHNKLEMNGSPFEEYVTDPGTELDTAKWITNIYFPVKN